MAPRVPMAIVLAGCTVVATGAHAQAASQSTSPNKVASGDRSNAQAGAPRNGHPDVTFLEYLGSLENDDENWTDVADQVLDDSDTARGKSEADARTAAEKK